MFRREVYEHRTLTQVIQWIIAIGFVAAVAFEVCEVGCVLVTGEDLLTVFAPDLPSGYRALLLQFAGVIIIYGIFDEMIEPRLAHKKAVRDDPWVQSVVAELKRLGGKVPHRNEITGPIATLRGRRRRGAQPAPGPPPTPVAVPMHPAATADSHAAPEQCESCADLKRRLGISEGEARRANELARERGDEIVTHTETIAAQQRRLETFDRVLELLRGLLAKILREASDLAKPASAATTPDQLVTKLADVVSKFVDRSRRDRAALETATKSLRARSTELGTSRGRIVRLERSERSLGEEKGTLQERVRELEAIERDLAERLRVALLPVSQPGPLQPLMDGRANGLCLLPNPQDPLGRQAAAHALSGRDFTTFLTLLAILRCHGNDPEFADVWGTDDVSPDTVDDQIADELALLGGALGLIGPLWKAGRWDDVASELFRRGLFCQTRGELLLRGMPTAVDPWIATWQPTAAFA